MTTLLDLIQEWASLNEAKTEAGGVLPPKDEERWNELREFYELLMEQDGLCAQPLARYSASQIRRAISNRSRLRVRTDLEIVVMKDSEVHFARVGNLSCGGVLLLSDSGFETGTQVLLHLANVSRGAEVLPTRGDIVWSADSGSTNGTFRYRMGVQFADLGEKEERSLDAYVVDSLETKLLSLSRDALPKELVEREGLTV
jgi:Tfp pilus assembly protein PilZ